MMRSENQHAHSYPNPPSHPLRRVLAAFKSRAPGMTLFNTLRSCIYGAVLLFTIICLAMAGHFQQILASSDLTRFVPFAIFVCTASLIIVLCLLGFSFMFKERNPISTRIELACLGLAGTLWLVLGVYLTTSESQDADVECFASESDVVPMDESIAAFQTDQYQAMYRVLMTFALLNAILLLFSFFTLLALAVMRHRSGDEHMWYGPVTSCAWFNRYNKSSGLPGPGGKPGTRAVAYTEKPRRTRSRSQASPRQPTAAVHNDRGRTQRTVRHDAYARGASPRR
ncbi:hypothetical protein PTI98_004611 [Pleurotus ostreatus]|nr:hypothetical protein PTI98_004611 [Pleurotus ostreatus]